MPFVDDVNRLLRDHTGYTGDGQGNNGPLPVGDRSTARFPINKRDLRELLIQMAQTMGDPEALQDIIDELGDKADATALDAEVLAREALEDAHQQTADTVADALPEHEPSIIPIPITIAGASVPLWLNKDGVNGPGIARSKTLVTKGKVPFIFNEHAVYLWGDRNGLQAPGLLRSSDLPVLPPARSITDGASLFRYRAKQAQVTAEIPGAKAKLLLLGDSWNFQPRIPRAFRQLLGGQVNGFYPAVGGNNIGPETWATTGGWTFVDGSDVSVFPYGAGPDGVSAYTTGTTPAATLTEVVATDIHIFTRQFGGTWRYQIDGGDWTTVAEDASGDLNITSITGLTDEAHTLVIDTAPNTGTVASCGIYATSDTPGYQVLKMGNGGTTANRMQHYLEFMPEPLSVMQPDAAVVILGTNDYRMSNSPPALFVAVMQQLVDACRMAVPDMGFIFVIPPLSDGSVVNPLSEYRDVMRPWVEANGHEMISLLDRWGTFEQTDALGMWNDPLHTSDLIGAPTVASDVINSFNLKG